jgi:anthranilate phosphoribosyltransferase
MTQPVTDPNTDPTRVMRSIIQRIATGPDLSKDISELEAELGMRAILDEQVDPVQAGIFFIALRMKRETMEENKGVLNALRAITDAVTADVDEVLDIADPYDGYNRTLPASPFLAPLLAECGVPTVTHGLDRVGPKNGITHRHIWEALGVPVDLSTGEAAQRLADPAIGWSYVDQAVFAPRLHDLLNLRGKIIKRQVLTTVEVMCKPISGKLKTHFMTGYVHKPYPPIYAELARHVGFDSAVLVRGTEGGVIPSLRQEGKYFHYHDKHAESPVETNPKDLGIDQTVRSVGFPDDLPKVSQADEIEVGVDLKAAAKLAAELGMAALRGEQGPTYDSLVYSGAIALHHVGKATTLAEAAGKIRAALDSGKAAERVK